MIFTASNLAWCEDWPSFCHDHLRTGISNGAGPATGTIAWSADLGGSVDGSPIVSGDRIYVGNSAGVFFCLRQDTGEVLWKQTTGGAIIGAAEIGDGKAFIGSADRFLYAFDASSGERVWRHRTLRPVLAAPVFLEDRVILGSMDGSLRAVDPSSGKTIWSVKGEGGISSPPAVREGTLYYGDESGCIYARKTDDGTLLWEAKLAGRIIAAPTIAGNTLLVPLMSLSRLSPPKTEFLTAWNLDDGKKLWTIPKPGAQSVMCSPLVVNGVVWVATVEGYVSEGKLVGFRLTDGAKATEQKMGRLVIDASPAVAGDTLYVAGQNGIVYFMNAATGGAMKRVQLGGKVFSSPAIADGRLYVGCQDGKLYCIE